MVPPLKVLVPASVSVPRPCLAMPPAPVRPVAKVMLLPLVSKMPPAVPSTSRGDEEMSIVLPAAHCRPPPFRVIVPVPKLLNAEKLIRPALIVVPPV